MGRAFRIITVLTLVMIFFSVTAFASRISYLITQLGIILKQLLRCITSLAKLRVTIREPRTALLNYLELYAKVNYLSHL